jgi:hypothetical protein
LVYPITFYQRSMLNRTDAKEFAASVKPLLEQEVRGSLPASFQNIEHTVFSGSERLPAIFMLLSAELLGGKAENILPAAAAIEYVNSCAGIFEALATDKTNEDLKLAGILGLLNASYGLMFANTDINSERAIRAHHELVECIGSGGLFTSEEPLHPDIYTNPSEKRASKMAIIMQLAARVGATLAGADHMQLEALSRFGGSFGQACQLKDKLSRSNANAENLTSDLERAELIHRLNILIDEARQILTTHFSKDRIGAILLELTESLAGE